MFLFLTSIVISFEQLIYALIIPGMIVGLVMVTLSLFLPSFQYKIPTLIGGVIIILFFTYHTGKQTTEAKYKLKEIEQALVIAKLEAESAYVTTEATIVYVDKIKIVEKIKTEFRTVYVDKYITPEIDNQFPLPNSFVTLHDSAVRVESPPEPTEAANQISSIPLSSAITVITSNYLTCKETEIQLTSLQKWIRDQQKLYSSDSIKKDNNN